MGFELVTVDDPDIAFSLNNPSMAWLYEVMHIAGAMSDEQVTPPELPEGWDEQLLEAVATFVEGSRELTLSLIEVGFELEEDPKALHTALGQVVRNAPDAAQIAAYEAFSERREAVVTRPGAGDKVPSYKFESQDGWLVTPDECRALAAALGEAQQREGKGLYPTEAPKNAVMEEYERVCAELQADPDVGELPEAEEAAEWVEDWIEFNAEAADLGGYRVF